jgi:hypothetical protein
VFTIFETKCSMLVLGYLQSEGLDTVQCNLYTNSCINFINKHVSTYIKLALYPLILFHQQTIIYC